MTVVTDENALASWWAHTQAVLRKRGVATARGEVSGRSVAVVGLDPAEAPEATTILIEVLKPKLCLWETELEPAGATANYRIGLLADNGWQVIECGTHLDDWDEDDASDEDPEAAARSEEATARLSEIITATAKTLLEEIAVGKGCGFEELDRLLRGRIKDAIGDDVDLQDALDGARWDVHQLVRDSLLHNVRTQHVDTICSNAETYARQIQEEHDGLESLSRTARRDAVYRALKKLDRCMTRESSRTVTDALESVLENRNSGLF